MPADGPYCIQPANAILGESPHWDNEREVLYWVDCNRPAIFRWNPRLGQTGHWPMPIPVGCVASAQSGRVIFADADGFGLLDVETGDISRVGDPEPHLPHNRFNDGKVDRAGRMWAGTMKEPGTEAAGSLYRLDPHRSIHRLVERIFCANGLGWSPDNRIMYFTDSMPRTIWAYDFDFTTGAIGDRRVFAQLSDEDGLPDGLTVDAEGYVWSVIWDGWRVIRFAPNGAIDREVRMPVQRPTSCIFGGPELKTLFITSASVDLDRQDLKKGPLAGGLFALETHTPGLPEVKFMDGIR